MPRARARKVTGTLSVIGGVYWERCRYPRSDELYGSGGRAAAVVAGLGIKTTLHTAISSSAAVSLASLASTFNFDCRSINTDSTRIFRYEHGLATPTIDPPIGEGHLVKISTSAQNALVFGMIEAQSEVRAQRIVFDPQNPVSAKAFTPIKGTRPTIAYVLNRAEARSLSGEDDPGKAARRIARDHGATVVVVKLGARGALLYEAGTFSRIPCYRTDRVWPIGSGDVFGAVFAVQWACRRRPARNAALAASRGAAIYANSRVLPVPSRQLSLNSKSPFPAVESVERKRNSRAFDVYLAGPFFSIGQHWLVEEARSALQGLGLNVFSPLHDIGPGGAHDVAPRDIDGLRRCRVVLALVDGLDAGTVYEVGYARSLGKHVVALAERTPEEALKMMVGTGCDIEPDFVTAIYKVLWASRA